MKCIIKCSGEGCPKKKTCSRYLDKDSMWQSYFKKPPHKGKKCDYYVKREEEPVIVTRFMGLKR